MAKEDTSNSPESPKKTLAQELTDEFLTRPILEDMDKPVDPDRPYSEQFQEAADDVISQRTEEMLRNFAKRKKQS